MFKPFKSLFLLLAIWACEEAPKPPKPVENQKTVYEPKFKKEGELEILSAQNSDTLARLEIELAETEEEQAYGMMYRKHIPEHTGMLFIRPIEEMQSFWMRNTYVPLDIIYINSANQIVSIQKQAQPLNDRSLPSEGPALYVLEVAGGYCSQYGIKAGDKIVWRRQ